MYVDAYHNRRQNKVYVSERCNKTRARTVIEYPIEYSFFYPDPKGTQTSIDGTPVSEFTTKNKKEFTTERDYYSSQGKIYQDDIKPEFRILEKHYKDAIEPVLNVLIIDIEADFCKVRGYAPSDKPFNQITAISLYRCWDDITITLAIPPKTLTFAEANSLVSKFDNTILFDGDTAEKDMLTLFAELVDDSDVITGWNSTGYDIPYIINRMDLLWAADKPEDNPKNKLCLFGEKPIKREYEKFKKISYTYDLVGRVHLDYLELYQKHNQQQLHSYTLDFVGNIEVGDSKVAYEKSLDHLYNNDFEKFIDYSRQDVKLLAKIHKKKKFIELANQVAHSNCVNLRTTMGSVALITQAIALFAHKRNQVIPGSKAKLADEVLASMETEIEEKEPAIGAYVADPKTGISKWVGAIDINSLYPSVLRALMMSPETLYAQVRQTYTDAMIAEKQSRGMKPEEIWINEFACVEFMLVLNQTDDVLIVDFDDGEYVEITAKELYNTIFAEGSDLVLSANATLFRKDKSGIIPAVLEEWYSDRKRMQAKEGAFYKVVDGISIPDDILALL